MNRKFRRCVSAHDVEPIQAALVILIVAVGALSVVTFRALDAAERAQNHLTNYQIVGCERGRLQRGWIVVDAGRNARAPRDRQDTALALFPVVDCSDPGKSPPLPAREQDAFLTELARQMGIKGGWRAPSP